MFERNNEIRPADLKDVLEGTAFDIPPLGKDNDFGAGVPRLSSALRSTSLVNTFDRFLELHAVRAGGLPTNWTFDVDDHSTPIVSIADLTPGGYDPCDPSRAAGRLRMQSPLQYRTVGYVWDEQESYYSFTTNFRFDTDPHGDRWLGLLLRWDPETRHCVFIRTRQVVPTDPTSTEFVFGHEEPSGSEPYRTVPWTSHHFDFQDMTKDYNWMVRDHGGGVSLWVGVVGEPWVQVFDDIQYTTAVPSTNKGVFVQAGAGVIFDDVGVWNTFPAVAVSNTSEVQNTAPLSLVVTSPLCSGVTTFEVTKKVGFGLLKVYNVTGREVQTLPLLSAAGIHTVRWNGLTANGLRVPAGVYFARVLSGAERVNKKFIVMR